MCHGTMGAEKRRIRRLARAGLAYVEAIVVVAIVALGGIVAWQAFASDQDDALDGQGATIAGLGDGSAGRSSSRLDVSLPTRERPSAPPAADDRGWTVVPAVYDPSRPPSFRRVADQERDANEQELVDKVGRRVREGFGGDWDAAWEDYAGADDKVDMDELGRLLEDSGIGTRWTRWKWKSGVMKRIDTDGDGFISRAELDVMLADPPATPAGSPGTTTA